MNYTFKIAKRITFESKRKFSKLIVRIAIVGIALGIMIMLLSIGIIRGFKQSIEHKLVSYSGDFQISGFQNDASANSYIQQQAAFEFDAKKDPNVDVVIAVANKICILQHKNRIEPLMIKGLSDMNSYDFAVENMIKGRRVRTDQEIVISNYLAAKHSIDTGERLLFYFTDQLIKTRKYTVVGIYESSIDNIDKHIVLSNLGLVRSVNDWSQNQLAYYQIHFKSNTSALEKEKSLERFDALLPLDLKMQSNEELYLDIYEWISLLDVNAQVIIILMLIVSGINMISAILVLILERISFIGILKTMGSSNRQIRRIFYWNASYLMLLGLSFGNFLALIIYFIQDRYKLIELDPESYYMKYVSIHLELKDFILLNLGTIIITLGFVLIASLLINKIKPLRAIRFN